jgi:CheY-like chemotaxis protein
LAVACIGGWFLLQRHNEGLVAQAGVLDLRNRSLPRGAEPNPTEAPLVVNHAARHWNIYLRLVLADDSDVMRPAIVRLLKDEPRIEFVGEATSFAETLQLAAGLKPDVLLLDLHMRDEREYPPELVNSQVLLHTKCIVAISLNNDDDARALAESFGAHALLDKMKLHSELIPAIRQFCPQCEHSENCGTAWKKRQTAFPVNRKR